MTFKVKTRFDFVSVFSPTVYVPTEIGDKKKSVLIPVEKVVDEEGNSLLLPIDQFSSQPFMLNDNGFITNDIMMFEEAQSESLARTILSRVPILHPQNAPDDADPNKLLRDMLPSNLSSPAEYMKYQKFVAQNWYNDKKALAEAKKAKENTIDFTENKVD